MKLSLWMKKQRMKNYCKDESLGNATEAEISFKSHWLALLKLFTPWHLSRNTITIQSVLTNNCVFLGKLESLPIQIHLTLRSVLLDLDMEVLLKNLQQLHIRAAMLHQNAKVFHGRIQSQPQVQARIIYCIDILHLLGGVNMGPHSRTVLYPSFLR